MSIIPREPKRGLFTDDWYSDFAKGGFETAVRPSPVEAEGGRQDNG